MDDLSKLPKVDLLRKSERLRRFPEAVRTLAARAAVEQMRRSVQENGKLELMDAGAMAEAEAEKMITSSLKPVVNASGVILHTGLGRARLAPEAARAIYEAALSHVALEIDLESGDRGDRQTHLRGLLRELTGAEDAHVVNNCASAIALTLNALCLGREVILSRGQMVEIGGRFRMPEIVRRSGCALVEVGCTNKTRMSDYEEALTGQTAAILRCHPSNFRMVGFVEAPSLEQLAYLASQKGTLCLDDLGSGCLIDTAEFGLPREPRIQDSIVAGVDVVTCSGDKLLGGPQSGLILGKKEHISRIAKHPLARAVRVDKLTVAALEATLRLYATGRQNEVPTIRYLSRGPDELKNTAESWKEAAGGHSKVEEGLTEVGGGSVPGVGLATYRLGLPSKNPELLARSLRTGRPAILVRIEKDCVWLDPRTVEEDESLEVIRILKELTIE